MFLIKPVTLNEGKLIATNKASCFEQGDAQIACVETSSGVVYVGESRYGTVQDLLSVVDAVNAKYAGAEAIDNAKYASAEATANKED